jgi:hypothetical protein
MKSSVTTCASLNTPYSYAHGFMNSINVRNRVLLLHAHFIFMIKM